MGTLQIDRRRGVKNEAGIRRVDTRQIDSGRVVQKGSETRRVGTHQTERLAIPIGPLW